MTAASSPADLWSRREAAVPRGAFHIAPLFVERAKGALLWGRDGKEYIDFCGGIGVLNVGHNHPKVTAAIHAQVDDYLHTCWHVAMYEPYLELAERLNRLVPMPGPNKSIFFNSGAEAGENAVKIARAATGRAGVVTFERGFHGRTLLAMTMTGKVQPYTKGFGPFAPEVYRLPVAPFFGRPQQGGEQRSDAQVEAQIEVDCRAALERLFSYHIEAEGIACVLVEPVLGEGGFLPIHPTALRVLREVTREHGILLGSDEVQTGFARCGSLFAIERYGVVPDMVLMAKSLGGGLPLSGVTGPAEIMDAPQVGGIGGTFGGNPVSCAAALAVLDVIEEEGLSERARTIGGQVMERFEALVRRHAHAGDCHGLGAMCGLAVVDPESGRPDAALAGKILAAAREEGLLAMTASGNVIRTLMPLVITDEQLTRGLDILERAVASVAGTPKEVA